MRSRPLARSLAFGWMTLAALLPLACGDGPGSSPGEAATTPSGRAVAAIEAVRDSFVDGDLSGACAGMTAAGRARLAHVAPGDGGCPAGLRAWIGSPAGDAGWLKGHPVLGAKVDGRRATATVAIHPKVPGSVTLTRVRGRWKLDDVAVRPIMERSSLDVRLMVADAERIRTSRMRGGRRVSCVSSPNACAFRVTAPAAGVVWLTALGAPEVARCRVRYDLHIQDAASIRADGVRVSGPPPCDEIAHCAHGETGLTYPWQGYIVVDRDGRFVGRLDSCLRTPLGHVRGFLYMGFARNEGDWTASPIGYPIGESPFELGGRWDLSPDDLELVDARAGES